MLGQQLLVAFSVPAFLVMVGVENGDEVVQFATAQRVVHEMAARSGPQHDVGPPKILRHLLTLEHAAIGDVAGDARFAVADDALADFRPHAVAGDQRATLGALAVLERGGDAVAVIFDSRQRDGWFPA